jgi:ribonucleoside-diphosphate reductase alpha chain
MNAQVQTEQSITRDVLTEKYAFGSEKDAPTTNAMKELIFHRVAKALASVEEDAAYWEERFNFAYANGLIPAGRVASSAGTGVDATLINCFVQPIGDSIVGESNGKPGIYVALQQSAETLRRGGGVGYHFGDIRPRNAMVKGTNSNASGPVSYMSVFDSSCRTVESAGARRGAQMGTLRISHPDVLEFVNAKKEQGALTQFNISVGVTNHFMDAVRNNDEFELFHEAEPSAELKENGAYQRDDGQWVYSKVVAKELWNTIIQNTYDAAEPGVIFLDRMNEENNLYYAELIEATNPCGEQPLPSYGSCCLSSVNLTTFVKDPFTDQACFDFEALAEISFIGARALDNVLELTFWPLEEQKIEAENKRRVGLGYTGLGDALIMLGLRYNSEEGVEMGRKITEVMRDAAYTSSIETAKDKGAFKLFDAKKYLASKFVQRLPANIRKEIKKHGIRNSHLLSIAPTGTISLAFADNASNGIEPAFSWFYDRKKRLAQGGHAMYRVEDHAYRVYREMGGDVDNLPESFVSALEISAHDHMAMMVAVQPYIDSAISKTVNVPADYPFEEFKELYTKAYESGLKGLATFRPNLVTGSVLSVESEKAAPADIDDTDPNRKVKVEYAPTPALASLRFPSRPKTPAGNPSTTYMVEHPVNPFAVMVGHLENGKKQVFEVWVNGAEAPRGLGALAKSLSTDMRSFDRQWLKLKLDSLAKTSGNPFDMAFPPAGDVNRMPSAAAALARLVNYRCEELGTFDEDNAESPMIDALISDKEPKTGTDGTMSWTVDVKNPATGDDFLLVLKELVMPDGTTRPYSVWMSGDMPETFCAICKSLSIDMRIVDVAWISKKLRSLAKWKEPQGDFLAREPGSEKQQNQPSTLAYVAKLILHRYKMLGLLNDKGFPVEAMGAFASEEAEVVVESKSVNNVMAGKECNECGNHTMIKKDGCDFCTSCGNVGSCG